LLPPRCSIWKTSSGDVNEPAFQVVYRPADGRFPERLRTRFEAREQGRESVEKDQFMIRLAIILAALAAGCTTTDTTTTSSTGSGNPYFLCRTADYVRHHIDVCSGILR
jgi:hypothetical protein